jgi:hypothetical protein
MKKCQLISCKWFYRLFLLDIEMPEKDRIESSLEIFKLQQI